MRKDAEVDLVRDKGGIMGEYDCTVTLKPTPEYITVYDYRNKGVDVEVYVNGILIESYTI